MSSNLIYALMTMSGENGTEFAKHIKTFEEIKKLGYEATVVYKTKETHPQPKAANYLLAKKDLERLNEFGFKSRAQPAGSLGVGNAIKDAIGFAYEESDSNSEIIYIEPDKFDVVKDGLKIADRILSGKSELVIPKRSKRSISTYPRFQQFTELILGTRLWNQALGVENDVYFSIHAYSRKIAPLFFNYPGSTWTAHYEPILLVNPKLTDFSVEIDSYNFPEEDFKKENDNKEIELYRLQQVRECTIEPLKRLNEMKPQLDALEKTVSILESAIRNNSA